MPESTAATTQTIKKSWDDLRGLSDFTFRRLFTLTS